MKRWARWSFVAVAGCALWVGAGCARKVELPEEPVAAEPATPPSTEVLEAAAALPEGGEALDVREIRIVEDNGQQGVFLKLSRPPVESLHYSLENPTRLVIDLSGPTSGKTSAGRFSIEDNALIRGMRLGEVDDKLRLTIELKSRTVPTYTVDALDDTVVAFIGEPTGRGGRVREQIVFRGGRPVTALAANPGNPTGTIGSAQARGEAGPVQQKIYSGQRVSLDFKDADVHNVLRLLAEVSKLNIVATDDVRGKVTLKLFEVPWDQALDIVLQALNLEMVQEGNVIRISTVSRLRAEREELRLAKEAQKAVEPLRVEYIRVNYAKAVKLAELISGAQATAAQAIVSGRGSRPPEDGVLTDRGTVLVDDFTNTIIVRDIQRGIDNARELVRRLDVQTPQVLIESNIVEATTDFARDLGVQWGYQANVGPNTGNPTGYNFPGTIGVGGALAGLTGVPFLVDFPARGNFATGRGSGMDLNFGSLDGSQNLNVRITALESQGKGKVISRPRVVTLNNVPATIKSLTIIRVKLPSTGTVINTGAGGSAGTQQVATEKIETGIILVVTPLVSSDGFVLLDLYAKSSQADFSQEVEGIPTEISREANSHILVKDGQTVVLGGIYRDVSADVREGVPYLKDIPVLGWLFRRSSDLDRREDLLVFLTPRILGQPAGAPPATDLWRNRNG